MGMNVPNRLIVSALALATGVAGVAVAAIAFRPVQGVAPPSQATEPPAYEVTFPVEPTPADGWKGHYSVVIVTNLPEGTTADLEYKDELGEGGGCCTAVVQGALAAPLVNNHCVDKDGILQGSKVTVQVIVAPNYGFMIHGGPEAVRNALGQPDSVLAVLGTDFENLNGPDVQIGGGVRMLIASAEYQLPADTCVSPYSH